MPKVGKANLTKKPYIPKKDKSLTCAACGNLKNEREYYTSYNPIHLTGRIPYCKSCLKNMISDSNGNVSLDKLKSTLQLIDRPFIYDLWKISIEDNMDSFGCYMKNLSLKQNRGLTWSDSLFKPKSNNELNYSNATLELQDSPISTKQSDFIVTEEIIDKWNYGYSAEEYYYFEKKWNKLIGNYGEKTSFHIEGLKTYIRFRVKEELATASGDVKSAKEWAALAKDAATAAKINVNQLSKSDISGGIELVPQIFEAVESEVGIISILPYLKEQPYDDADIIIWCIINYGRRLEDKSRVEYKEIWQFYDQMLEEYYKQKGFSEQKIKEEKVKRNNIFRDLGEIYKEPIYEESDL